MTTFCIAFCESYLSTLLTYDSAFPLVLSSTAVATSWKVCGRQILLEPNLTGIPSLNIYAIRPTQMRDWWEVVRAFSLINTCQDSLEAENSKGNFFYLLHCSSAAPQIPLGRCGSNPDPLTTGLDVTLAQQRKSDLLVFPEKELRGLSSYFHIHVSVSYVNIPRIGLHIYL